MQQQVTCPNCDQTFALSAPKDPLIGKTLGQFEVVSVIGSGGMGTVYKARQESLGRFVALKVLARGISRDAGFVERFRREARSAAAVNHPNIIEVYFVGEDEGYQYMAMELVEGESLFTRVRRTGPLPADLALSVLKQTTSALTKAHAAGLVHRDIKPGNILLTPDNRVKVVDFGVALRKTEDVHLTQVGRVVGTIVYMAPEVAAGGEADERSDLYSLGGTFYCALTGSPPFGGTSTTELAIQHTQATVPPLLGKAPDTPSDFARIIHRLLNKKPEDRFTNAQQLLTVLGRVGQGPIHPHGGGESVEHKTLDERRAQHDRGSKRLGIVAAVAAVAAVAVLAFLLLRGGDAKVDPPEKAVVAPPAPKDTPKPPPKVIPKKDPTPRKNFPTPAPPAWTRLLEATSAEAKALVAHQRYGEAIQVYTSLNSRIKEDVPRSLIAQSVATLRQQAESAAKAATTRAKSLMRQKSFDGARKALKPIVQHFGVPKLGEDAKALLAKIDKAETAVKADAEAAKKAEAARLAAAEESRKAEAAYTKASEAALALAKKWDFAGATAVFRQVAVQDMDVRNRCEQAHKQFKLLAALKGKMIAKVNASKPPLRKSAILIMGINGDLTRADETGITARMGNNVTLRHPWGSLTARTVSRLGQLSMGTENADDWFSIALLALQLGDAGEADLALAKAKGLGADVDAYTATIADAALAKAKALVAGGKRKEAAAALDAIDTRFAASAWHTAHKADLDAARTTLAGSKTDAEADAVYAKAAKLYAARAWFDLKPLVVKLQTKYPTSKAVTDATRKPSMADLLKATANLGARLVVRKDGKSPYSTIQAAVNAAAPSSLIEIQDSALYCESISIPSTKPNLTIAGAEGVWPVLTLQSGIQQYSRFFQISAPGTVIKNMVLTNPSTSSSYDYGITVSLSSSSSSSSRLRTRNGNAPTPRSRIGVRLEHVIMYTASSSGYTVQNYSTLTQADHCVFITRGRFYGPHEITNSIWLSPQTTLSSSSSYGGSKLTNCMLWRLSASSSVEVRNSTVVYLLDLMRESNIVVDSVVGQIRGRQAGTQVTHSCLFGKPPFLDFATPGTGCIMKSPGFANPKRFDFRLKTSSPCRKRASDGGDMGCRYTPGMIDMLKRAFDLRTKGVVIFKF